MSLIFFCPFPPQAVVLCQIFTIFTCSPANWSGLKSRAEQSEAKSKRPMKPKWACKHINKAESFKALSCCVALYEAGLHKYGLEKRKGLKAQEDNCSICCFMVWGFLWRRQKREVNVLFLRKRNLGEINSLVRYKSFLFLKSLPGRIGKPGKIIEELFFFSREPDFYFSLLFNPAVLRWKWGQR